jgi:eukaryotic-like serine/threonine-protein kinase
VLQATPSPPVAVPPVPDDPKVAATTTTTAPRRRRRSPWPWIAAVAVLAAVVVIAGAAYLGTRDADSPATSPGSGGTSASDRTPSSDAAQAAAMRSFITTYLSTVTTDQHASWAMLTKSFQRASHGFGSYQKFWRAIASASPHDINPDPAAMTVSYGVDYTNADGSTSSDQVTLELVKSGSSYLINGEG